MSNYDKIKKRIQKMSKEADERQHIRYHKKEINRLFEERRNILDRRINREVTYNFFKNVKLKSEMQSIMDDINAPQTNHRNY